MKRKTLKTVIIVAAVLSYAVFMLDNQQAVLSDKLIRLHVVGATDSQEDQSLKLKIKDRVVSELDLLLNGAETKDEAQRIIEENLDFISWAAQDEAVKNGNSVSISSEIKVESFPTRGYDTFSLPPGYYTSLRITIDEGKGHNWWCVVYPNVCSDTVTEKNDFTDLGLSEQETDLITMNGEEYVVKFKLIEIIEEIKMAIFGQ